MAMGTAPRTSCQPVRVAVGIVHRNALISTVPTAQRIAEASMRSTPAGAARSARTSGAISTARPAVPRTRATALAAVSRSPRKSRPRRTVQSGIV